MVRCFVIQPFDGGKFDKRYNDVFDPAVRKTGLEPYRVDRDPSVSIPIEEIQSSIESSAICLADITLDNPNVWFELGYAFAVRKEVILVCSTERTSKFPFDVHHRTITRYSTDSPSDFDQLRSEIEARIKATLQRQANLGEVGRIQSLTKKIEGLNAHEIATLVSLAELIDEPSASASAYQIRNAMENAGFSKIATTLGLKVLLDKGMLEKGEDVDYNDNRFVVYKITDLGMQWLMKNQDKLKFRKDPPVASGGDDIPF